MAKDSPSSTRRTISRDLMLGLALMTALIVSAFGIVYRVHYTNKEIADLATEAAVVADEFAEVLVRPLWNMDGDTVIQITRAYLSSGFLTGVQVKTGPDVFFDNLPENQDSSDWLVEQRSIVNAGETIGSVELHFSKARIDIVRKGSLLLTLVTVVLVTAVIGLGTHMLMKRLMIHPMNRLVDGIRTIAAGNYQYTLPLEKHADVNAIISEINIMAREIDRRESDLNRLRGMLKNIIDSMPSVLVGVGPDGRVNQWNREAEKQTRTVAAQAMGSNIETVYPFLAGAMQKVKRAIHERQPHKESKVTNYEDGEVRYSDITIYPLTASDPGGAVIRMDDITERVRIEEMMVQSEKMLSVGGLAAGMAHEINNPLAGILQNIQVMQNRLASDLPQNHQAAQACGTNMAQIQAYMKARNLPEMIAMIMDSGKRAAKIVENMLSFSRKSEATTTLNNLAQLMDATLELAENDYDLKKRYDFRQIQIERQYDPQVPMVACEATKIQQVFLNILKNGAQAMAEQPDGPPPRFILRVKTEGDMACVEIEDNGPGMDETVRKRIFEPFFTTKSVGIGTGLGLSVSYFIITENHGGTLGVTSTPGIGTCFSIHLPVKTGSIAALASLHPPIEKRFD
jgi:PAS domain S-box-containing protein